MVVRDDDSVSRPDEAGAEGLRRIGTLLPSEETEWIEEGVGLPSPDRGLGLNVDDGWQHAVRDKHDGRAACGADSRRDSIARGRLRLPDCLRFRGWFAGQAGDEEEKADL